MVSKDDRAHRGKLPVVIPEGMTWPVVPIVVAKFAIECNIAVRNHIDAQALEGIQESTRIV
jgi:hypothetical protein